MHKQKTRWTWRLAAGVALASLALVGSAPLAATARQPRATVNLTFWSWVPNLNTSVDLFNRTHPGIHVTWNKVVAGNLGTYAKMFTALKANNAPDLGQVEYQFLPTFESTGGLVDMGKYGASAVKNSFVSWTWSQSTLGASVYAIPQDSGPMGMYYRADLFKKYNIAVPTTWAQYADAAVKLHKANSSLYITDFPPKDAGWFIGLLWQRGSRPFRIAGNSWKVAINDSNARAVAQYWQNMLDKKLVKTDPDFSLAWNNDLATGGSATWVSAVWGANTIPASAPKTAGAWKVAPMPQWTAGANTYGNWGGSTTVVFKSTKHPKEATEFAEFLNSTSQSINRLIDPIKGAALYPALKASLDQPAILAPVSFYGGQRVNQVFNAASNRVDVNFQWGPTMDQVFNDMSDDFSTAVNGKTTLPAALDTLQQSTVAHMQKLGISVSK